MLSSLLSLYQSDFFVEERHAAKWQMDEVSLFVGKPKMRAINNQWIRIYSFYDAVH